MKECHIEGLGTHDDPESCADSCASATQPMPATRLAANASPRGPLASQGPYCSSWPEQRFDGRTRDKSPVR